MTQPNKSRLLLYLVIFFGGVLLIDCVLSWIFSLPAEATSLLTKASLDVAAAVAALGFAFARQSLNMKVTLIVTGFLWLGLTLWVFSARPQSPRGASTTSTDELKTTEFLGHHLGESAMEWKLVEDPLGPNPVEVCQDIVKSGAGAESDQYKDCETFLVGGQYIITTNDWKTNRERKFRFASWKLDAIVEKFTASEHDNVTRELNLRFGAPQKSDSAGASWEKSDAKIQVFYSNVGGAILLVAR